LPTFIAELQLATALGRNGELDKALPNCATCCFVLASRFRL